MVMVMVINLICVHYESVMQPLGVFPTGSIENCQYRPPYQPHIPAERSVLHVIDIQLQADGQHLLVVLRLILELVAIDVVPQARLARQSARHTRADGILAPTGYLHLVHSCWTGSHNAHRAVQDVQQLRQLVNLQPTHHLAPPEDTVLIRTERRLVCPTCHPSSSGTSTS